jgi:hypothetical protein
MHVLYFSNIGSIVQRIIDNSVATLQNKAIMMLLGTSNQIITNNITIIKKNLLKKKRKGLRIKVYHQFFPLIVLSSSK